MSEWVITDKREYAMDIDYVDKNGDVWYDAYIKWDGCCNVRHFWNAPKNLQSDKEEDYEQMHICDIPQFIKILQSIEDFRMANLETAE